VSEIVGDHIHRGAFVVRSGRIEQSWVDLDDPLKIEFDYVQRIAEVLEETILLHPAGERARVLHIGGGGLSIPRYVAARRPGTRQTVFEPDADLVDAVRSRLPLPRDSGIRVRITDGRSGIGTLADESCSVVIVDAFSGSQVPGELATSEFFQQTARVLDVGGLLVMNIGDKAPFAWGRRMCAAVRESFTHLFVIGEVAVWKGRRYGNLVVGAADREPPIAEIERRCSRSPFPHRLIHGNVLRSWIGGAEPFTDAAPEDSVDAVARGWLG
jgi:spermidine synthase